MAISNNCAVASEDFAAFEEGMYTYSKRGPNRKAHESRQIFPSATGELPFMIGVAGPGRSN